MGVRPKKRERGLPGLRDRDLQYRESLELDRVLLGHRVKTPIQREAPTVVPAPQLLFVTRALDDEGPAMGAHVRHAVDLVFQVSRQQEWLVESARQQCERMHLTGDLHEVVVTGVVPRAREETVALESEDLGVGVHARR
jgi:hypothetical protein